MRFEGRASRPTATPGGGGGGGGGGRPPSSDELWHASSKSNEAMMNEDGPARFAVTVHPCLRKRESMLALEGRICTRGVSVGFHRRDLESRVLVNRVGTIMSRLRRVVLSAALTLVVLGGCVINPVTGDRELALVSADQEIAIGEQQYQPSQQMQGGDYALDPELTSYVAGVGQKLAAVSDRQLPYEFVVLNSSVPNAWALPGGKIAVNRGLLTELGSEAELAAVLGHEIVHAAARHGALAMQRGLLLQGALIATQVAAQRNDYGSLAVGAASLGAQLLSLRNGRDAELESDLYGMRYMAAAGYDPTAAITLQETFVRLSEQNGGRGGRLATLFASHPPSEERVQKNRETAATLAAGGDVGRERYQAATARLREREPAYDAYDEGRAALADDRPDDAERSAQEAVAPAAGRGAHPRAARRYRPGGTPVRRRDSPLRRRDRPQRRLLLLSPAEGTRAPATAPVGRVAHCPRSERAALAHGRRGLRARHAGRAARRPPSRARVLRAGRVGLEPRGASGPGRHGAARLARQSRQIHPSARRARQLGPTRRRGREPYRSDGNRRGRGRTVRGRARRDPRARPAHRPATGGASHALRDGSRPLHVDGAVSGRRDSARVARND